jgi:hypothetical protein
MQRILIAVVFALACSIHCSPAQQASNSVDRLTALGLMEVARGSNSVSAAVSALKGTLLEGYRGKVSEGFKLYARFTSALSEKEIAARVEQRAIAIVADGAPYDPAAPDFPGSCFVPDHNGAAQEFRAFVQDALKRCKRYYSVSGQHRIWITLYVEEGEHGQKVYHLFHGFTFE